MMFRSSPKRDNEIQRIPDDLPSDEDVSHLGYPSNRIISNGRVIANRTWEANSEEIKEEEVKEERKD